MVIEVIDKNFVKKGDVLIAKTNYTLATDFYTIKEYDKDPNNAQTVKLINCSKGDVFLFLRSFVFKSNSFNKCVFYEFLFKQTKVYFWFEHKNISLNNGQYYVDVDGIWTFLKKI